MKSSSKNSALGRVKGLDHNLIDGLYKDLTKELSDLIKELNDSSKISAFGAMATLSTKISDVASDLKKLQRLPSMLTNPLVLADPREILDEICRKYSKKRNRK